MAKYTIEDVRKSLGSDLTEGLLEVVKEEGVVDWYYRPNSAFDGKAPCDVDKGKLEEMIYLLGSGAVF